MVSGLLCVDMACLIRNRFFTVCQKRLCQRSRKQKAFVLTMLPVAHPEDWDNCAVGLNEGLVQAASVWV